MQACFWEWQQNGWNDTFQRCKINITHTKMTAIKRCMQWWAWMGNGRIIGGAVIVSMRNSPYCWVSRIIGWSNALKRHKIANTTTKRIQIERIIHWWNGTGDSTIFGGDTWFWMYFPHCVGWNRGIDNSIWCKASKFTIHIRKRPQSMDKYSDVLGWNCYGILVEIWAFPIATIRNDESFSKSAILLPYNSVKVMINIRKSPQLNGGNDDVSGWKIE